MPRFNNRIALWITAALMGVGMTVVASGCGVESTGENGKTMREMISLPRLGNKYTYSVLQESPSGTSNFSYIDSVKTIEQFPDNVQINFATGAGSAFPVLIVTNSELKYEYSYLNRLTNSYYFAILPLDRPSYRIAFDSAEIVNNFRISDGRYEESSAFLGCSSATIHDSTYSVWKYRFVHSLSDTIEFPTITRDTLWIDYAPELGYFTRLEESSHSPNQYSGNYYILAILDTVLIPK